MTWEKPVAFWQGWLELGPWPWHLWRSWAAALGTGRSQPELALRLFASSLGAARRAATARTSARGRQRPASQPARQTPAHRLNHGSRHPNAQQV